MIEFEILSRTVTNGDTKIADQKPLMMRIFLCLNPTMKLQSLSSDQFKVQILHC